MIMSKVAVVTGASRGIGRIVCHTLAKMVIILLLRQSLSMKMKIYQERYTVFKKK